MKQVKEMTDRVEGKVAPRTGAWIETTIPIIPVLGKQMSPPVRGRGLKHTALTPKISQPRSPPVRGRGLKQAVGFAIGDAFHVAPRTGAWIETSSRVRNW